MPLWGNRDNSSNSDIAAVIQMSKAPTTANQSALYDNVTPGNGPHNNPNVAYGQFGVDTNEIQASTKGHGYHAGWVLRKEGTGLRAGRVTYETLVAMGSMSGDGSDDTTFPDRRLTITTNPTSNTSNVSKNLTFTVAATSTPSGATIAYKWQKYNGATWVDLSATPGQYFNVTTATLTANNQTANGNVFRAVASTTGANSVTSTSATILYVF